MYLIFYLSLLISFQGFLEAFSNRFKQTFCQGFPCVSVVRLHLLMQDTPETWVLSLGGEDLLEKGMATPSSILAWEIPYRGAWRAIVHRVAKIQTRLSTHTTYCQVDFQELYYLRLPFYRTVLLLPMHFWLILLYFLIETPYYQIIMIVLPFSHTVYLFFLTYY